MLDLLIVPASLCLWETRQSATSAAAAPRASSWPPVRLRLEWRMRHTSNGFHSFCVLVIFIGAYRSSSGSACSSSSSIYYFFFTASITNCEPFLPQRALFPNVFLLFLLPPRPSSPLTVS